MQDWSFLRYNIQFISGFRKLLQLAVRCALFVMQFVCNDMTTLSQSSFHDRPADKSVFRALMLLIRSWRAWHLACLHTVSSQLKTCQLADPGKFGKWLVTCLLCLWGCSQEPPIFRGPSISQLGLHALNPAILKLEPFICSKLVTVCALKDIHVLQTDSNCKVVTGVVRLLWFCWRETLWCHYSVTCYVTLLWCCLGKNFTFV